MSAHARALRSLPSTPATLASAVHALCDTGWIHEATEVAYLLVRQHPDLAVAQIAHGRALLESGDGTGALAVLAEAATRFPSSVTALRWWAEALLQCEPGDPERLHEVITRGLSLSPNHARLRDLQRLARQVRPAPGPAVVLPMDDAPTLPIHDLTADARPLLDAAPPVVRRGSGNEDPTVTAPYAPAWWPATAAAPASLPEVALHRTSEVSVLERSGTEEIAITTPGPAAPARRGRPGRAVPGWLPYAAVALLGLLASATITHLVLRDPPRPGPVAPTAARAIARPLVTPLAPAAPLLPAADDARPPPEAPAPAPEDCAGGGESLPCQVARASLERRRGNRAAALTLATRALQAQESSPRSWARLGLVLVHLGELDGARATRARLAVARGPHVAEFEWLARALRQAEGGVPEASAPDTDPGDPELRLLQARVALRRDGVDGLRAFLRQIPAQAVLDDDDLRWLSVLGRHGTGPRGARFATELRQRLATPSPVTAYVAGLLAGDHRRLAVHWLSRALVGHGDVCHARRLLADRLHALGQRPDRRLQAALAECPGQAR